MLVSTQDVLMARRSAQKLRTWAPCLSCKANGKKCTQYRPCSRCLKSARPCFRLGQATTTDFSPDVIPVQRPLSFQLKFAIGGDPTTEIALAPGMIWAKIELMKHQGFGHSIDSLSQFFASLTVHDCSAISLVINEADVLGRCTVQHAAKKAFQADYRDTEGSEFWGMETGTTSFRTTFDPMIRRRRDIIANACHASMYGMHPEEFQARCASRALPNPFAEEDAVALIIFRTVSEHFRSEASSECFFRLYVGSIRNRNAALFSARTSIAVDAFGGISEVRSFLLTAR
jgi:hypothetical protein